jgi:hypothetical protein
MQRGPVGDIDEACSSKPPGRVQEVPLPWRPRQRIAPIGTLLWGACPIRAADPAEKKAGGNVPFPPDPPSFV